MAILGVFVIAYGDSLMSTKPEGDGGEEEAKRGVARLIGNLLAFIGSVSYAWYEVWYKINGERCLLPFSSPGCSPTLSRSGLARPRRARRRRR